MTNLKDRLYLTIDDAYELMPSLTKLQRARLKTYIENTLPTMNPQVQGILLYNHALFILDPDQFWTHRLLSRPPIKKPIL